jgi:hypothetical protein
LNIIIIAKISQWQMQPVYFLLRHIPQKPAENPVENLFCDNPVGFLLQSIVGKTKIKLIPRIQ